MSAKNLKLAVVIPSYFQGGVVRSALNIVRMLAIGARAAGEEVALSFGIPVELDGEIGAGARGDLEDLGVRLRMFRTGTVPKKLVTPYYRDFVRARDASYGDNYLLLNDGVSNFEECDFLFFVSDHVHTPMPPHIPYGVALYDYVQRYVPEILPDEAWGLTSLRAEFASLAQFAVCTTQQARRDAIDYAGCDPARVHVFPVEFDPPRRLLAEPRHLESSGASTHLSPVRPYVLWSTIISQHENHLAVLAGLEKLVQDTDVDIIATGFHTQSFDPRVEKLTVDHPYVHSIRDRIRRSSGLSGCLQFRGFVEDSEFVQLMRNAECVLHTSIGDNGSYSVLEAAWLGTPAVSSRYPAMQEISAQFDLPLTYWDLTNPDSLCAALQEVLRDGAQKRAALPTHERLSAYSYRNLAPEYWRRFAHLVRESLARHHQ